ncbi:BLI-3 blue-light-inducible Bli-3 protein [Schaereria dolodes]|nr:BLI-3 blue-light-inducible Bli-3 protein [Schaereria dolodes]
MSDKFSNADTGDKPADPYKATNKDEPSELKEKVQDLVSFMKACKFAMMTTRIGETGMLVSRCMALAASEGNGIDLIFHTNTESGKTDDLKSDPQINIAFLNSSGEWASLSGEADVVTDRELVRKHYSPALKAWLGDLKDGKHDGGPEDPRIGIIKVKAKTATYAVTGQTIVGRSFEVAKGIVTGEAPSVNKLREISEEELEKCELWLERYLLSLFHNIFYDFKAPKGPDIFETFYSKTRHVFVN